MLKIGHQAIKIVGVSTVTSNDVAAKEIGALWEKFSKSNIAEKLPGCDHTQVFSVYSDYESDHTGKYRVTIGHAVTEESEIPNQLSSVMIPKGNYKEFEVKSPSPADIVAVWKKIWSEDMKTLPRNYISDFEVYTENGTNIYIGLKI